jgi:riboflavin kinase
LDRSTKLENVLVLAKLLTKGARHGFIDITTATLGNEIRKSQQASSNILLELERLRFIERSRAAHGQKVRVTKEGFSEVRKLSLMLNNAVNLRKQVLYFEGRVVSGVGEGAYYMSLEGYRKQFEKKIGYIPFLGTLNLEIADDLSIENRENLESQNYYFINGFSDPNRSYGWVKCYPVIINDNEKIQSHLLILERTHHAKDMLELISPLNLKHTLSIRNGDYVNIKIKNT